MVAVDGIAAVSVSGGSERNRAKASGSSTEEAASTRNSGLRFSLANSQRVYTNSSANAFTPCHALEIVFQRVLAQMGVADRQPGLHEGFHRAASVQPVAGDRQFLRVHQLEILHAQPGVEQPGGGAGVRNGKMQIPSVLLFQLLQAFLLQQHAMVDDADVVGQ